MDFLVIFEVICLNSFIKYYFINLNNNVKYKGGIKFRV